MRVITRTRHRAEVAEFVRTGKLNLRSTVQKNEVTSSQSTGAMVSVMAFPSYGIYHSSNQRCYAGRILLLGLTFVRKCPPTADRNASISINGPDAPTMWLSTYAGAWEPKSWPFVLGRITLIGYVPQSPLPGSRSSLSLNEIGFNIVINMSPLQFWKDRVWEPSREAASICWTD